jgi:hypothetical protein
MDSEPRKIPLQMRRLDKQEIVIPDLSAVPSPDATGLPVPAAPSSPAEAPSSPVVVAPPVPVPHASSPFRGAPGMRSSLMPAVAPPDEVPPVAPVVLAVHRQKVELPSQFSAPPPPPPDQPSFSLAGALALGFTALCIVGAHGLLVVMPMLRLVAEGGEFPWPRLAASLVVPFLVILLLALRRRLLTLILWGLILLAVLATGGLGCLLLVARELLPLPPAQLVLLPSSSQVLGGALLLAAALFLAFGGGPVRWMCGVLLAAAGVAAPFAPVETWAAEWIGDPKLGRSAAGEVMAEGVAAGGMVSAGGRYVVKLPAGWNIPSLDARPSLIWAPANVEAIFARDDRQLFVALWRERAIATPIQVGAFADARLAGWRRQLTGCQGMTSNPQGKADRYLIFALAGGEIIEELCVSDGADGVYVLTCRGARETVQTLRKELEFIFNGFAVSASLPPRNPPPKP